MTNTAIHPLCSLSTPFGIVFNAVADYGYNHEPSLQKYMFHKCVHISGPKVSLDVICNAFDVKFHA